MHRCATVRLHLLAHLTFDLLLLLLQLYGHSDLIELLKSPLLDRRRFASNLRIPKAHIELGTIKVSIYYVFLKAFYWVDFGFHT